MEDKIWVGFSLLGAMSKFSTTAFWGCVTYESGTFTFDGKKFESELRPAADEGANICRILAISLFGNQTAESVFQPFKYMGNGKWDLAHYNDYYFPIVKEAIQVAKSVGITLWFELFDHCGLWTGAGESVRHLNPWANNIQGYDSFYHPSEFVSRWVNRCITEFGDEVKYGLGNELTEHRMIGTILPFFKSKGVVPFSYGADLDIHGEENHNSVRKLQSLDVEAVWSEHEKISLFHNCHNAVDPLSNRVILPVYWWKYHSICFSDDGAFPRPEGAQWAALINYVLSNQAIEVPQYGQGGKARLMFECCPETENPHLITRAMVAECEKFGVVFKNKGKYPEVVPENKPITPDPVTDPVKPEFSWRGEWNNNKWWILGFIGLIVLVAIKTC